MATKQSTIIDQIEARLNDSSNAQWSATVIQALLPKALAIYSEYFPYEVKETIATTDGSKDITISSITDLIKISKVEFPVDLSEKSYQEFEIFGDTLRLTDRNGDGENAYLECHKIHHIDVDWTVNTAYTKGQFVSPTTENGYRYECTVAGTSHATTEPTWPTTGTKTDGTVTWTTRAEKSRSLKNKVHEEYVVDICAALCALRWADGYINAEAYIASGDDTIDTYNAGGADVASKYESYAKSEIQTANHVHQWGQLLLDSTKRELNHIRPKQMRAL